MKHLLFVSFVPVLVGCEAFSQAAAEPAVIDHFQKAADAAASGDMSTALVATISGASALLIGGIGKWLYGKAKDSPPGSVLG